MKISYAYTGAIALGLLLSFSGQAIGEQVVFEGDSFSDVYEMLGEPNIEFPRGKTMIRWYEEYQLVFKNDAVASVLYNPKKPEPVAVETVEPDDSGQNTTTNMNPQLADDGEDPMGVEPDTNAIQQAETNVMDDVESAVTNLEPLVTASSSSNTNSVTNTSADVTTGL